MKSVKITADLERRLRSAPDSLEGLRGLVAEMVILLDTPRHAESKAPGLGYKELVAKFRDHLGAGLALPPNPSVTWIIKQVNRAKEIGLDGESIRQTCEAARRLYPRPPWELEFLVRNAPRLLAGAVSSGSGGQGGQLRTVRTGRPEDGD